MFSYDKPLTWVLLLVGTVVGIVIFFLLHYLLFRAVSTLEQRPLRGGITMLVYGLLWAFSLLSHQAFGGIIGIVLIIGGILALTGMNAVAYGSPQTPAQPQSQPFYPGGPMPVPGASSPATSFYSTNGQTPIPNFSATPSHAPAISFNEALTLAQAGKKLEAYQAFKALEATNPADFNLCLWLAFTAPTQQEAQRAVTRASQLNPDHPSVIQAREWLSQESRKVAAY